IDLDVVRDFQLEAIEHHFEKLLHRMGLAGGDYVVVGIFLLQHQPHCFDVVAGETPIALRFEISERELLLDSEFYPGRASGDFACDEIFSAPRRLVIEKDSVACEQPVGFAIIYSLPVRVKFCACVGTARMKWSGLALRNLGDLAEHLRRTSLVKARGAAAALVVIAERLQQAERAESDHVGSVFGLIE